MKVRFLKQFIDIKESKERHVDEEDYITRERYEELAKYKLVEEIIETPKDEVEKKPKKRVRKNEEKPYNIYE